MRLPRLHFFNNSPLVQTLIVTFAPLLSLFVFILGNGLFNTLITVRLHVEGYSAMVVGAMTSAYYGGLFLASFKSEAFIIRVGHIRAFAAFASALAITSLAHGFYVDLSFWLVLRAVGGFATAGLFIVIESWLLVQGSVKTRGQVLAVYMLTLYAAQGLGQFFIDVADPKTLHLFAITAMLCSLSVIPLACTRIGMPQFTEPSILNFKTLYQKSASGIIGSFASGLILAPIYGLLPLYIAVQITDNTAIAVYMALVIFGGMALQYPVGRVSDYIDRRMVLLCISLGTGLIALFMTLAFHWYMSSLVMIFLFGGFAFTLYPVSISHACDALEYKDIISGTQGLLLAYSAGAVLGPLVAALFIRLLGVEGLFLYFFAISAVLSAFFLFRRVTVLSPATTETFMPLIQTTPVAAELDPRGEYNSASS